MKNNEKAISKIPLFSNKIYKKNKYKYKFQVFFYTCSCHFESRECRKCNRRDQFVSDKDECQCAWVAELVLP